MSLVSYTDLTCRNIGFVSPAEQDQIREAAVFVCGIGGMGGACLQSLVRMGVTRLAIADPDTFEVTNLNRQVFAFASTLNQRKVDATRSCLLDINPALDLDTFGQEWTAHVDAILSKYPIVVNGMDDLPCEILLYRKAREHGATVIDAYTSPLPSVTVVRPQHPRPEERLGYPTVGKDWRALTPAIHAQCRVREIEYVLTHSSSASYLDLHIAAEVLAGKRPRISFAPMVITTGNLMCFEVLNLILGRPGTDYSGYFFNPWTVKIERPRPRLTAWPRSLVARRLLKTLMGPAGNV
ncbi:MAG: ThiF family adenylyltransferase [Candidatus Methylomirabilales bacterium]